jgi:release factor glutamine methyltransferase
MLLIRLRPSTKPSQELFQEIYQALLPGVKDTKECKAITQRILTDYFQFDLLNLALNKSILLTGHHIEKLHDIIRRIYQNEPIQYILGKAPFMGRDFQVSPAVLIPRPETEELVASILKENHLSNGSILEIGTGSGCIAVTLKKAWPSARIDALEISTQALNLAAANANYWNADINWIQGDLFQNPLSNQQWDLIVSNPPYVRLSERQWMHPRVLEYEPKEALFVPDDRPLIFYEKIAQLVPQHLKPTGKIYLEINEAFGLVLAQQFASIGMQSIHVQKDLQGKDRWISATMPA